jgi:hypothetical protein
MVDDPGIEAAFREADILLQQAYQPAGDWATNMEARALAVLMKELIRQVALLRLEIQERPNV